MILTGDTIEDLGFLEYRCGMFDILHDYCYPIKHSETQKDIIYNP